NRVSSVAKTLKQAETQRGTKQGGTLTRLAADVERDASRSSDPARVRRLAGVISDLAGAAR
ncbi:MAG TPA: hypothetical protein VF830_06975, partial [Gemmatimonadales bacterium]